VPKLVYKLLNTLTAENTEKAQSSAELIIVYYSLITFLFAYFIFCLMFKFFSVVLCAFSAFSAFYKSQIMFKILTLNINGIRSGLQKGFTDYLTKTQPDIVCLQEIKASFDKIPVLEFQYLNYECFWFPARKRGYGGTAILTKIKPDNITYGMEINKYDDEGRLINMDIGDKTFINVYHPSGSSGNERQEFKMKWLDDFYNYILNLRKEKPNLIISGDFNICHKPIDIHDSVGNAKNSGFLPEEREWMTKFFNSGFIDTFRFFNSEPHHYSWWSFRGGARQNNKGWRIDYNVVSENLKNNIVAASMEDNSVYLSDHCPVFLQMEI